MVIFHCYVSLPEGSFPFPSHLQPRSPAAACLPAARPPPPGRPRNSPCSLRARTPSRSSRLAAHNAVVTGTKKGVEKKVGERWLIYVYIYIYVDICWYMLIYVDICWYMVPSGKRLQNYGQIHHFSWENPLFLWSFSIAMLIYQRVCMYIYIYMLNNWEFQKWRVFDVWFWSHVKVRWVTNVDPLTMSSESRCRISP